MLPMRNKPSSGDDERAATTTALDARDQAGVLRQVLSLWPQALTLDELVREMTAAAPEFSERDRIERAVSDLVAGGLLHRNGAFVLPTRAAVLFYELEEA
jgi:hypothetical protein